MTRPAVIIGVGGTGQWVLTYVKKDLIESSPNGEMPKNVALLCIDTMMEANAQTSAQANTEDITVGGVSLTTPNEFIGLSGNYYEQSVNMMNGFEPWISKRVEDGFEKYYYWFDVEKYRQELTVANWNLVVGAGQVRQFGRLGFFKHSNTVLTRLQKSLTDVGKNMPANEQVEVILVSSFAGGTGAGMLVDTALLARMAAQQANRNIILRGIFILPDVFSSNQAAYTHKMQARAFAAWRELNRFMNLGPDYGAHEVVYDTNLHIPVDRKPFDQCFLIGNNAHFQDTRPEQGAFPAISDFIGMVLDDEAGDRYRTTTINLINPSVGAEGQVVGIGYSTFGVYSFKIPINAMVKEYALLFGRDILKRLLVWKENGVMQVPGRQDLEVKASPRILTDNQNQQAGAGVRQGRDDSREFFVTDVRRNAYLDRVNNKQQNEEDIDHTLFWSNIYNTTQEGYNQGEIPQDRVDRAAQGGYCGADDSGMLLRDTPLGWLAELPQDTENTLVQDDKEKKLIPVNRPELQNEVNLRIWNTIKPSNEYGDEPCDALNRFAGSIPDFIKEHYGAGDGTGLFGKQVHRAGQFQTARFKELLKQWTLNIMNGTVGDAYAGLSGRMGYLEDLYLNLRTRLENYASFLDKVAAKRGVLTLLDTAKAIEAETLAIAKAECDHKCIFYFHHPKAHMSQRDYLMAVQNRIEVRKDDIALNELHSVIGTSIALINSAIKQVNEWKRAFLEGGANVPALYDQLGAECRQVISEVDAEAKNIKSRNLRVIHGYPADEPSNKDYPERLTALRDAKSKVDDALKNFGWDVDAPEGGFSIVCRMYVPEENSSTSQVQWVRKTLGSVDDPNIQKDTKDYFMRLGREVYKDLSLEHLLVDELKRTLQPNYGDPNNVAKKLVENSQLMFNGNQNDPALVRTAYFRMNIMGARSENMDHYSNAVEDSIQPLIHPPLSNMQAGHSFNSVKTQGDLFKCTLVVEVDRLGEQHFNLYNSLQQSYLQVIQQGSGLENASRLHIFPAECNAARYECRGPAELGRPYRIFSPRVVLLMQQLEIVRNFFLCWALGVIKISQNPNGSWSAKLSVSSLQDAIPQDITFLITQDQAGHTIAVEPDIFEMVNEFQIGVDKINKSSHIVSGELEKWLRYRMNQLGSTEWKRLLDAQVTVEGGIVKIMRAQAREKYEAYVRSHPTGILKNPGWKWVQENDYVDLADVVELIYRGAQRMATQTYVPPTAPSVKN